MSRIFHPLLYMIACATRQELARQIHYLKVENEILRARLPRRIIVRPDERKRLLKAARGLGNIVLKQLVSIISPHTFAGRVLQARGPRPKKGPSTRKPGRPKTPEETRKLVIQIATDTGWGYTRILGELRKLGCKKISRQTVKNILVEHGLDPGPKRGAGTWDEFLKMHAKTLWQCDFFTKRIWTAKGLRLCFVLVFINVATRKVFLTRSSFDPNKEWVADQAGKFIEHVRTEGMSAEIVTCDNDGMFGRWFDDRLGIEGIRVKRGRPASPNLQAYVERFVQTIGQECLDHFVVLGQKHYDFLISEFTEHYLKERPHQGLDNVPLSGLPPARHGEIVCRERLGGLLKHYERVAA